MSEVLSDPQLALPRIYLPPDANRQLSVAGYVEEGTTTKPFDMLVLNKASRYHLCLEGLRRAPRYQERAREFLKMTEAALDAHRKYVVKHLEDMPAITNWKWTPD